MAGARTSAGGAGGEVREGEEFGANGGQESCLVVFGLEYPQQVACPFGGRLAGAKK